MSTQEITCSAPGGSSLWPEAASEDIKKAQIQSSGNATSQCGDKADGRVTCRCQKLSKAEDAILGVKEPQV